MAETAEERIARRKDELVEYVSSFYRASWNYRSQAYHNRWDKYDRAYNSIYDPQLLAKKEQWQTALFIGITVQNVEVICSQIFKTMASPSPMIQTVAGPAGDPLQAELIQEVMEYEIRKGKFPLAFYDALKEAVRYGTGFVKLDWERVRDLRYRRVAQTESPGAVVDSLSPQALMGQEPTRQPDIYGYSYEKQEVLLKDNLWAKCIHIRDIFPEPNTRDWKKVLHRDKMPYGSIVDMIQRGVFFDVRDVLDDLTEGEKFDDDLRVSKADRDQIEQSRTLTKFEKNHTIWELWAPIPRKWLKETMAMEEGDDAEVLVPAKVMVASGTSLLLSEENTRADAEAPILKLDYIRTNEPYGKGVPELIMDDQDEINEIRNQRVDNVNLILNKMIAVIDEALVSKKDLISRPGGILRLKRSVTEDVSKAIRPLEFPDVTASSYRETLEIERQIQERTGANRVTLGSSGVVKDTNQTLGGMEMLRQMFNERVAAYGMILEMTFLLEAAEKIYALIYQECDPEHARKILGSDPVPIGIANGMPVVVPRFMAFAYAPPEEINLSYKFKPMGIFTMENKIVKTAQVLDLIKLFGPDPRFDVLSAGKYVATKLEGIDEADKWFNALPPMMPAPPGGPGPTPPGGVSPSQQMPPGGLPVNPKSRPGMQGGPNGNGPSFLPPNPVRRQPVA